MRPKRRRSAVPLAGLSRSVAREVRPRHSPGELSGRSDPACRPGEARSLDVTPEATVSPAAQAPLSSSRNAVKARRSVGQCGPSDEGAPFPCGHREDSAGSAVSPAEGRAPLPGQR